jgi:hypothetical protein
MVTNTILAEQLFMAGNLEWEGVVPKAGLFEGGLLKSLIGAAIPFLYTVFSISPLCCSLLLPASIQPGLYSPLTLY